MDKKNVTRKDLIARAAKVMEQRLSEPLKAVHLASLDDPNSDDEFWVYYGAETVTQRAKYYAAVKDNNFEATVMVLVTRALSKSGKHLFTMADYDDVKENFPPEALEHFTVCCMNNLDQSDFDEEGNLVGDALEGENLIKQVAEAEGEKEAAPVEMGES